MGSVGLNSKSGTFAIQDVKIFTGHGFIDNGYLIVKDGIIAEVGSGSVSNATSEVSDENILRKPGHTVTPGFIDSHIHLHDSDVGPLEQSLRFGVTTVCDMHNDHENMADIRKQLRKSENDKSVCCDVKWCGCAATVEGGWPAAIVLASIPAEEAMPRIDQWPKLKDPAEVEAYVQEQIKVGASYIKLMHEDGTSVGLKIAKPSTELQTAVIKAAHAAGLPCVAHCLDLKGTLELLRCGVDGLTHTFLDQPPTDELVDLYKRSGAHCNPTLAAIGSLTTEGHALQEQFSHDPLAQEMLLSPQAHHRLCQCMSMGKNHGRVSYAFDTIRALYQAGVPVIVGSDSATPAVGTAFGLSLHMEMRLLAKEVGMKSVDVLKAATSLIASRFKFDDRGVLAPGKRADVVLFGGDLEETLTQDGLVLPVKSVWREGVLAKFFAGRSL